MPLCLCLSARASSRVAKMFTDKFQTNHNHIMTFLYLKQVKAVLFIVISATSYYQFLGSTPFEITCGS